MSLSRRKTLALIGGGVILSAAGGMAAFLGTRTPTRALAPWDAAGVGEEPRRKALSYALLAPNPHNRQPWLVDLSTPETVVIWRDEDRDLPVTDPYGRQLTIGMGCFIELMRIAAAEDGYAVDLSLFPQGDAGPVAIAHFSEGAVPDPLFAHVMSRRSCKEPYRPDAVPAQAVTALSDHGTVITDPDRITQLRDLTWRAWLTEAEDPAAYGESVDLMRFGRAQIEANPDGIDLGGPMLETLMLAGLLNRESQRDPSSTGYQEGVRLYREMLTETPAYIVQSSPTNTREDQIAAGAQWLRANLAATGLGLAVHPVSQALQEYPAMATHYREAHALLAPEGHTLQMLARLGYGPEVPRTPRWPLETRMMAT